MIPKTCISLGLRSIPPGAGLARRTMPTNSIGRHWLRQTQTKRFLQVVRDENLESEIKEWQKREGE